MSAPRTSGSPGDEADFLPRIVSPTFIYSGMLMTPSRGKELLAHFTADTVSTQWIALSHTLLTSENGASQRALQRVHQTFIKST